MENKQALDIVKQACAAYKGDLKEHQVIQQAIQVLSILIEGNKDNVSNSGD